MIDPLSRDDIENVRQSVDSFGFGLLPGMIVSSALKGLQKEAEECKSQALFAQQSEELKYSANITSLGPQARDFLRSRQLTELLSNVFGGDFVLTEHRSCLTFYNEGDYLGPHLDQPAEECVVTILVYVVAVRPVVPSQQTGLELRIYGREMTTDGRARLTIPTHTGRIVVGRGSKFWHERPMLSEGEYVVALTGCYRCATCADNLAFEGTAASGSARDSRSSSAQMGQ